MSHQTKGGEGVAEFARSIPAARLSRSIKGGIAKTIDPLVLQAEWQSAEPPCVITSEKERSA